MGWSEIGRLLGISETRVRQLHEQAMKKMRKALAEDERLRSEMLDELEVRLHDQSRPWRPSSESP